MDGMDKFQSDMAAINARVDQLLRERAEMAEALSAALPILEARAPDFNIVNGTIRALLAKVNA